MSDLVQSIRTRYLQTLDRIANAARSVGRDPDSVKLVVVTKAHSLETTRAVIEAGAGILGENYPEEGVMKIQSLPDISGVEWHMIGHVQSRKAQLVAGNFNFLHSLDSLKLARRLDRYCGEAGRTLPVLLEFNVGGEESKTGWRASDEEHWNEFVDDIARISSLSNLQTRGLMCMPPIGEDPEFSRPYFQRLKRLREFLLKKLPQMDFDELSMGTSADYEIGIQEGATLVRVGTAIVGARQYKTEV